jgi:hypothetical protein
VILRDSHGKIKDRSKRTMRHIMIDVANFESETDSSRAFQLFTQQRICSRFLSDNSIAPRDSPFNFSFHRDRLCVHSRISIIRVMPVIPPLACQMRASQVRGMIRIILSVEGHERNVIPNERANSRVNFSDERCSWRTIERKRKRDRVAACI